MSDATAKNAASEQANGKITFANDVISTIAGLAASDVKGLAGMSAGMVEGFTEMLGRKNLSKGVKVEVGEEEAAITLNIIVKYGVSLQKVAQEAQKSVKSAIETMTGLRVIEVNVNVLGIEIEKEAPAVVEPAPAQNAPKVK